MTSRFEDVILDYLAIIDAEVFSLVAGTPDLAASIATIRQAADDLHRLAGSDMACPAVSHIDGQLAPEYRADRKALAQMRGER